MLDHRIGLVETENVYHSICTIQGPRNRSNNLQTYRSFNRCCLPNLMDINFGSTVAAFGGHLAATTCQKDAPETRPNTRNAVRSHLLSRNLVLKFNCLITLRLRFQSTVSNPWKSFTVLNSWNFEAQMSALFSASRRKASFWLLHKASYKSVFPENFDQMSLSKVWVRLIMTASFEC